MTVSEDKTQMAHVEGTNDVKDPERVTIDEEFSPAEQRRIKRRIDRRLVVTCGVMYCISLVDRTNLSSAAIAGMTDELALVGDRYVRLTSYVRIYMMVC